MAHDTAGRRQLSYQQVRVLLGCGGAVVLSAIALVMGARGVETVELVAVLLFVPVFLALLLWDAPGGGVAAVVASAAYVALRASAISAVGAGAFTGLIAARVLGYVLFGLAGGWANGLLRASLTKLDLYDHIDDATSLFNARYFVEQTDLEKARSDRYRTFFSVVVLDIPAEWFAGSGRRGARRVLKELGRLLGDSVRSMDRAVHCVDGPSHRIAVIMPETSASGASVFGQRLQERMVGWLNEQGASGAGQPALTVVTVPPEDEALARLREEFARVGQGETLAPPLVAGPAQG